MISLSSIISIVEELISITEFLAKELDKVRSLVKSPSTPSGGAYQAGGTSVSTNTNVVLNSKIQNLKDGIADLKQAAGGSAL